ncbi:MAG TPA: Na+/H+ antiporter [Usitatibacter sp.]
MINLLDAALALLALLIAASLAARKFSLQEPLLFVLTGLAVSFVPGLPAIHLDPQLVMDIFLPLLVYATAIEVPWRAFRANLRPIGFLGIGLVLFTTFGIAAVAHAIVPGLEWPAAFVLGALISPPDEVAAASVLQHLPIPQRLVVILKGEGLVNDVTALTIFRLGVAATVSGSFSLSHASIFFLAASVGGTLYGFAVGWVALRLRRFLDDPRLEVTVSLMTPFVAYLVPEHFGSTGVLAVAVAGLVVNEHSPHMISAETRLHAMPVWAMIEFLLNGVLFLLLGLQVKTVVSSVPQGSVESAVLVAAWIAAAIVVLRFAWVYLTIYSRWLWRRRDHAPVEAPRRSHVFLISWAGMRGAISLAAALAIPLTLPDGRPFPARELLIFVTFTVILATLILQGGSLPFVIRALGIEREGARERETQVAREFEGRLEVIDAGIARLEELATAREIPEEVSVRHRHQLEHARRTLRRQLAGQKDPAIEKIAEREHFSNAQAVDAQRAKLLQLRSDGKIDDDIVHRIERDLDEEERRLQGEEATLRG